jgi:signal transduction histidine kinase
VRAPRLPRIRWQPQRPDWHAILTLQRPRRAQLRTRVLAGVLAITVIALVAFDFAAVGALRRYLLQPAQHAEPVDVSALVTECTERAEITDTERAWHTDIAPGLSSTGDEELLRRAVDNLLANVRAHTPRDTTATLTAAQCNGSITIEVSDDGPGVPPGQLARIFDRFYRSGQGCLPGSGLGLVNAVAATHNGTAQASLNDPHGLRVTLTLPAAGAASAEPAAPVPHTVSAPR